MKQLKQSPVAKIIAWILITVSALMLLAGTAGAYAISELGFYTRSVEGGGGRSSLNGLPESTLRECCCQF